MSDRGEHPKPRGYTHTCKQCGKPSMSDWCNDCRYEEAMDIVRELADIADPARPIVIPEDEGCSSDSVECLFFSARASHTSMVEHGPYVLPEDGIPSEGCLWLRARRLVEAGIANRGYCRICLSDLSDAVEYRFVCKTCLIKAGIVEAEKKSDP